MSYNVLSGMLSNQPTIPHAYFACILPMSHLNINVVLTTHFFEKWDNVEHGSTRTLCLCILAAVVRYVCVWRRHCRWNSLRHDWLQCYDFHCHDGACCTNGMSFIEIFTHKYCQWCGTLMFMISSYASENGS